MPRSKSNLVGRALAEERSRELKDGLTAFNSIRRHFYDSRIILSDDESKLLGRLRYIWHECCSGHPTKTIIDHQMSMFGISVSQAYNDLKQCKDLFGDPKLINKNADSAMVWEMSLQLYRDAIESGDFKGAAAAIANMIKCKGLDRADSDAPEFDKIEIKPDNIGLPESQTLLLESIVRSKPVFDVSELFQKQAEDIEFIEEEE